MRVLVIEPGRTPEERKVSGSLTALQNVVGGLIQAIYPFKDAVALICNDEGKLLGLPMNRALPEIGDIICGPFAVVGAPPGSEHFSSLTDEQMEHYKKRFHSPEVFLQIGNDVFVLSEM